MTSESVTSNATSMSSPAAPEEHVHHGNYVKVWAILVVLLIISVLGPLTGIRPLILFTAFGIAIIKAYMVAKNFMHVNVERRWVGYLLITCLVFLAILFAGVAPDIMKHQGLHWDNYAAKQAVQSGSKDEGKHE
jgi:caa(3)-type oxidase subunit IV